MDGRSGPRVAPTCDVPPRPGATTPAPARRQGGVHARSLRIDDPQDARTKLERGGGSERFERFQTPALETAAAARMNRNHELTVDIARAPQKFLRVLALRIRHMQVCFMPQRVCAEGLEEPQPILCSMLLERADRHRVGQERCATAKGEADPPGGAAQKEQQMISPVPAAIEPV